MTAERLIFQSIIMSDQDLDGFRRKWLNEIQGKDSSKPSGSSDQHATHKDQASVAKEGRKSPSTFQKERSHPPLRDGCISPPLPFHHADDQNELQKLELAAIPPQYHEDVSNIAAAYYPFRILTELLSKSSTEGVPRNKKRTISSPATLPNKRTYFLQADEISKKPRQEEKKSEGQNAVKDIARVKSSSDRKGYLDLFIADLDEINEIPFFDTSLPREVAVKIFWHLDFQDLCRCAQVSKSWRSLAEDELLWCRICHKMGFDEDKLTVEHENWKSRVGHLYTLQHTLMYNWKNRIGKPYNLQYSQGGILCAATSHKSTVVAGYSNCQTKMWDVLSGETCVFKPSSIALVIDEAEEAGTIGNEILHVATCDSVTAASYSQGFVDVWSNEEGTEATYTFTCPRHRVEFQQSSLGLCEFGPESVCLAINCETAVQVHSLQNGQGRLVDSLLSDTQVKSLKWIQPQDSQNSPILVVASFDAVNIYTVHTQEPCFVSCSELHNIIDAPVTCIDARGDPCEVAVGYSVNTGPSQFEKVNMYNVATRKLTTSLAGHTARVSCVNLVDSPPHQLVTGSYDRKVRVYDTRIAQSSIMTFIGHSASVNLVQMDSWKVVSGDDSGFVCVWDQRMASKLWDMHNRHPVRYCHFADRLLVVAHVPFAKKQHDPFDFDTGVHQRHRGSLQVHDFLVDQTTKGVPEICLSTYDEPQGYNYNITLAMPYDTV